MPNSKDEETWIYPSRLTCLELRITLGFPQPALFVAFMRRTMLDIGDNMTNALITGITGQDGSYLAELLLEKGYRVYGLVRYSSVYDYPRIRHILADIELIEGDLIDQSTLIQALKYSLADEVYNLAAMTFVGASFLQPVATGEYTALGVLRMLEAVKLVDRPIRFFQESSSEMFGNSKINPQNELTLFSPCNPYGIAKLYGHWMTVCSRESFGLHACSGIFFNHESPRRGLEFVSRKITYGVARIHFGLQEKLVLGNLEAKRDWGFAGDYVDAMWRMLQQEVPDDYVIATGKSHRVRDFVAKAFAYVGIDDWQRYIEVDPRLIRPVDINELRGDATKAHRQLEWYPKVQFEELVGMMMESDLQLASQEMK